MHISSLTKINNFQAWKYFFFHLCLCADCKHLFSVYHATLLLLLKSLDRMARGTTKKLQGVLCILTCAKSFCYQDACTSTTRSLIDFFLSPNIKLNICLQLFSSWISVRCSLLKLSLPMFNGET